jgi:hypothetical protein
MEIKVTIDDRVVGLAKAVFGRKTAVVFTVVGGTLVGGVVFALTPNPPNTFESGQVLSAAALNENFAEVYEAVSALEVAHAQLQSEVEDLQADVAGQENPLNGCTMHWKECEIAGTGAGRFCKVACPSGTAPIAGVCDFEDESAPSKWENPDLGGTWPASEAPITDFAGWSCGGLDSGPVVTYVTCCPTD